MHDIDTARERYSSFARTLEAGLLYATGAVSL